MANRDDLWASYRQTMRGYGPDLRTWWARPEREDVPYHTAAPDGIPTEKQPQLSRGERKARGRFFESMTPLHEDSLAPPDPVAAIWSALGLQHGPIPGAQTQGEFQAYWTESRLEEIATRWLKSPHHRALENKVKQHFKYAQQDKVPHRTRKFLSESSLKIATQLYNEAFNPTSTAAERIRAQTSLLKLPCMGLKERKAYAQMPFPADLKEFERQAPQLLNEALADPDINRAKHRTDLIKFFLAKANPDVYGDRMTVNHAGQIDMVAVVADVQARRRAIEERHRQEMEAALELPHARPMVTGGREL